MQAKTDRVTMTIGQPFYNRKRPGSVLRFRRWYTSPRSGRRSAIGVDAKGKESTVGERNVAFV